MKKVIEKVAEIFLVALGVTSIIVIVVCVTVLLVGKCGELNNYLEGKAKAKEGDRLVYKMNQGTNIYDMWDGDRKIYYDTNKYSFKENSVWALYRDKGVLYFYDQSIPKSVIKLSGDQKLITFPTDKGDIVFNSETGAIILPKGMNERQAVIEVSRVSKELTAQIALLQEENRVLRNK